MNFPDAPTLNQLYSFSGITWKWNGVVWKIDTSSNISLSSPITWTTSGIGPPTFTTRSAGTKLVLYPSVASAAVDFGLGIETGAMWYSVQDASATHKWYAGTTNIATLGNTGLTVPGTITGITAVQAKPTTGTHGWVNMQPGNGTISGYIEFMSATGGIRQGLIGATNTNSAIDTGFISYTAGTHNFSGVLSVTTTNLANSIQVTDTGSSGANIRLIGSGGVTPNKSIRANSGNFEVVNHAYNSVLLTLTDAGALTVLGNVAASNLALGGKLTTSGAFTTTFTVTGNTAITLPTTGTIYSGSAAPVLGGVIYGSSTTQYGSTAVGTSGQVLTSAGAATPIWANLDLSNIDTWTKKIARMATTAVLTVTARTATTLTVGGTSLTIDGIAAANNDRVLVKNGSTGVASTGLNDNGIFVVSGIGTSVVLTRAGDSDTAAKLAGATVTVDLGTVNGGLIYTNDFKSTSTVGTTVMNWYQLLSSNDTASASTANKVVIRDASGDFNGSTITAVNSFAAKSAVAANGWIRMVTGNSTTTGQLEFMSITSGTRQGYIGASSTNSAADAGTIPYVAGTHSFNGLVAVNTTGSTGAITINDAGASGANLRLNGNGATTPNKFIRAYSGNLDIVNNAYNGIILQLSDAGNITVTGTATATNFIGPGTGLTGTASGLNIGGTAAHASSVTVNVNNTTAGSFPIVWHSGNNLYSTSAGFTVNPSIGYMYASSFNAGDWFRSSGVSGWYNSTYAGGVYMADTSWVRAYNGKGYWAEYYGGAVAGSSYGSIRCLGAPNGYAGVYLQDGGATVTGMYDTAGNGGNWDPSSGWHHYWNRGNGCLGIGGASIAAGYRGCTNGSHYVMGQLLATADVIAYSDRRVKDDIQVIPDALSKVMSLRGVSFVRNDLDDIKTGKRSIGLIAQEVEEILPELVDTGIEEDKKKSLKYGNMVAVLIEAIKELNEKVESLKAEIKALRE